MQSLFCIVFGVAALKDDGKTSNALLYMGAVAVLASIHKIEI